MEQYIPKAAVVAEIERIMAEEMSLFKECCKDGLDNTCSVVVYTRMKMFLSFLDTLKVKDEVVSTDPIKAMKEALRTEYEKGRADAFAEMQKEWSEEDKDFMYDTLSNLTELKDRYGEGYGNVGKCIDWLKILKQRIGG